MKKKEPPFIFDTDVGADPVKEKKFLAALATTLKTLKKLRKRKKHLFVPFWD